MFAKEVYIQRRAKLSRALEGELLLFVGNRQSAFNYASNEYAFRQDSTFLYLFGIDEPDYAAIIDGGEATIYADDVDMDDIIWMGPQTSVADKAAMVGIGKSKARCELAKDIAKAIGSGRKVHYVPPYRGETRMEIAELTGIAAGKVAECVSEPLIKALVALRSQKETCEIEELERHQAIGYNMHVTAMKMAIEGKTEQEIHAAIDYQAMLGGGGVSFPTICSISGQTLHNHTYNGVLKAGKLLLVDAGSESKMHYATDNTRTTPVNGKFSQKQKEIYQIVLDANNAVLNATKPGVKYLDMHLLAARTIAEGLVGVGIMRGDVDDIVERGAHAMFFPHGIGHMMGLDVHDMESYGEKYVGYDEEVQRSSQFGLSALRLGRRLQPGFVVTDEPGIYFIPELMDKWEAEGLFKDIINYSLLKQYRDFGGIRLEDDILVTENGGRLLGERIPITIEEVESIQK